MPRRFTKPIDLQRAQMARFEAMRMTARQGVADMARAGLRDAQELLSSPGPSGADRIRWLRSLGNPLGRGPIPQSRSKTKWTASGRRRGSLNALPVGQVTGGLYRSLRLDQDGPTSFSVGPRNPGGAAFRLIPGGTRFLVDSGYVAEMRRRKAARFQAFTLHFIRKQRSS